MAYLLICHLVLDSESSDNDLSIDGILESSGDALDLPAPILALEGDAMQCHHQTCQ